jgi:hypothetical protein
MTQNIIINLIHKNQTSKTTSNKKKNNFTTYLRRTYIFPIQNYFINYFCIILIFRLFFKYLS